MPALDDNDLEDGGALQAAEGAEPALAGFDLDALLAEEAPAPSLAERAAQTRAELLKKRESMSASTIMAASIPLVTCCSICEEAPEDVPTQAEAAPKKPAAKRSAVPKQPAPTPPPPPPNVPSMITHASRVAPRTSGPGHTFGTLPRVSPSGTMAHHVPAAATKAPSRPTSAHGGGTSASASGAAAAATSRPSSARGTSRPGSAAAKLTTGSSTDSKPLKAFGADAKGAVTYRPPSQPPAKKSHVAAFANLVTCCGEAFEDYCCRRHHPDDLVVCCEHHDPIAQSAKQKAMAKSAMGGRVGAGKGAAFSMGVPKGPRKTAIGSVPMAIVA